MLGLPKSTEFGKRIPKQKFYENLSITPALKRVFVEHISQIVWLNKIATTTVNIAAGEKVEEIEVFLINLTKPFSDDKVMRQIDKEIPYHILFLLEHGGKYQAWIGYKEASSGDNAFKVSHYYHTEWLDEDALSLKMQGMTLDAVWDNFLLQISGIEKAQDKTVDEQVAIERQQKKVDAQIAKLEAMARKEKQPKKKFELVQKINELKKWTI